MIHALLSAVTTRLAPLSDTPDLDASVLIAHILNKPRTWVLAHPELKLTAEQQVKLDDSLARLATGEAFPYVLGHWEFFGMELNLTPDVLIPRPETELLVEKAIAWLQESPVRNPSTALRIADVGTGSGAIAISIATHVADAYVLATDISYRALQVARTNAIKFDVIGRIDFVQCDLLPPRIDPLPTELRFDLICANLPYIPTATLRNLPIYGREPTLALDGGPEGLETIRRLLGMAPGWLAPNGMILLEIEATRGARALDIASDMFSEVTIHLHKDLAGQHRLLEVRF